MKKLLSLLSLSVLFSMTTLQTQAVVQEGRQLLEKNTNEGIEFPEPDRSYLHEWPHYEITDVLKAGYGVNDDTVRLALGNPHFSEFDSHVWNYLVGLRQPYTTNYVECQLQLHFDDEVQVEGIYWDSPRCPDMINKYLQPPKPSVIERIVEVPAPVQIQPQPPKIESRRFTLSADILFPFDSSELKPSGHYEVQKLVRMINLEYSQVETINVIGYTDRMGSESYNERLGLQRAITVKNNLISRGFNPNSISVASGGERSPVTDGCYGMSRPEAKACLQPDRRVDVNVEGILK